MKNMRKSHEASLLPACFLNFNLVFACFRQASRALRPPEPSKSPLQALPELSNWRAVMKIFCTAPLKLTTTVLSGSCSPLPPCKAISPHSRQSRQSVRSAPSGVYCQAHPRSRHSSPPCGPQRRRASPTRSRPNTRRSGPRNRVQPALNDLSRSCFSPKTTHWSPQVVEALWC